MSSAFGLDVPDLPKGWTALEVVCAVKAIDEDGVVRLCARYSATVNTWEAAGMHIAAADTLRSDLTSSFRREDES